MAAHAQTHTHTHAHAHAHTHTHTQAKQQQHQQQQQQQTEPGIASKFELPEVPPLIQKRCNDHGVPPIVVLNVSLPLSRPIMFGEALSRKCVTCVCFFIIKRSTLAILDEGTSHPSWNSVDLWTRWCNQVRA